MHALLCFPKLDLNSGTAQLLRMQALGLRAAGVAATVMCQRGALRFWLRTGIRAKRISVSKLRARASSAEALLVEHGLGVPEARLAFVHNLACEANRFLASGDRARAEAERLFFRSLRPEAPIVANSDLVRGALLEHFGLAGDRVIVHRPGFDAARFDAERRAPLRAAARRQLRFDADVPLVGFVTSGDFHKRGLDTFLAIATQLAAASPDTRFLVVGARRLPAEAAAHPLITRGLVRYVPKNHDPERWIAALDLFVYAARFEEFGMVVLEALALGVPVVTSRRVGAAECLPAEYDAWLGDEPHVERFAALAERLLADPAARQRLSAAGIARARDLDDKRYAAATVATILAQKRRLR